MKGNERIFWISRLLYNSNTEDEVFEEHYIYIYIKGKCLVEISNSH